MPLTRPILSATGSLGSRSLIRAMAVTGWLLSPVKFRLYWRACNLLGTLARGRGYWCVVGLEPDARMKIFLDDPYWARLVASGYHYETDFAHVLARLRGLDFDMLDCGANFGYWSILVSGAALGSRRVIAVEASRSTYEILAENCALNGDRFTCVHAASQARVASPL